MLDDGGNSVQPLVSVIAVTRNRPSSLHAALVSVKAQTFTDLEIIVVSFREDHRMKVASRQAAYMNRARFFELGSGDVLAAQLFGVQQAAGEWVTFLRDHDSWPPGWLAFQMEFVRVNNADMISIDDNGSMLIKKTAFLHSCSTFNEKITLAPSLKT